VDHAVNRRAARTPQFHLPARFHARLFPVIHVDLIG
jgi:hypothetical protein